MNKNYEFGPQYKRDKPFTARMRFHQSWFRNKVLRLPYGIGPQRNSPNKYGNMLTEKDGERGNNFLSPEIFALAKERVAEKTGAVNPYRLYCNLLSSMPMCFNLFGPLKNDLEMASELLGTMLPVEKVTNILFEFNPSPRKDYLDDRTAFDVFVEFLTTNGESAFVGIEVKLTEPFSQAKHKNPRYDYWTERGNSPWKEDSRGLLIEKDMNQLWRNHLLVQSLQSVKCEKYAKGYFMTVYHKEDLECVQSLEKYFSFLKKGHNASHFSLDEIRNLWEPKIQGSEQKEWFNKFALRYLDLSKSEPDYLNITS